MAFYTIKVENVPEGNVVTKPVMTYAVDSADDIKNLPGSDTIKCGSAAIIIPTKDVVMRGATGWV
jgi:hypothetical protein